MNTLLQEIKSFDKSLLEDYEVMNYVACLNDSEIEECDQEIEFYKFSAKFSIDGAVEIFVRYYQAKKKRLQSESKEITEYLEASYL